MAIYRNVHISFWEDTKVIDEMTPEDRYFMLYLLTNPHTNLIGCYEISFRQISNEVGYTAEQVENLINRMQNNHKIILYSKETKEILIKNWYKYNWTRSDKLLKAVEESIKYVKNKKMLEMLMNTVKVYSTDTVSIPYGYPMDTSDTDTVTDTVSINKNRSKFIIPSVEEITAYCKERKNNINAEKFFDFYESKGWVVGKTKMKDWKACIRTWESKGKEDKGNTNQYINDSQKEFNDLDRFIVNK